MDGDSSEEDEGVILSTRGMGRTLNKEISSFSIIDGSDDDSDSIGFDFETKPTSTTTNKLFRQRSRNPASEPAVSTNTINNRNTKNIINDDIETTNFRQQQSDDDPVPKSFSHNTKNQSSSSKRKDTSRKKKQGGDEFNMNDIADQLPKHLRTNLSQMSSTVRTLKLYIHLYNKSCLLNI